MHVTLDALEQQACVHYLELMVAWNARHNLTAADSPESLVEIMLADSMALSKMNWPAQKSIIDVGSGAGAPAIGWMILSPTLLCTCSEKLTKRRAFMSYVVGALDPALKLSKRVNIIDAIKDLERGQPQQHYDIACSRATFAPHTWLTLGTKLASMVIVFVTEQNESELSAIDTHTLSERIDYRWPFSNKARAILVYQHKG